MRRLHVRVVLVLALLIAGSLAAAAGGPVLPWGPEPSAGAAHDRAVAIAGLGRMLFFDPALSASERHPWCTPPRFASRKHGFFLLPVLQVPDLHRLPTQLDSYQSLDLVSHF